MPARSFDAEDTDAGADRRRRQPSPFRLRRYEAWLSTLSGDAAQRHRAGLGTAPEADPLLRRGAFRFRGLRAGKVLRGAAARSRPRGRSQGLLPRSRRATDPRLSGVLSRPAGDRARRRADPSRHARHHRMAARQGRGAVRELRAPPRHGRAAGDLSLHRRRSGRGGARQAPAGRRSPSAT